MTAQAAPDRYRQALRGARGLCRTLLLAAPLAGGLLAAGPAQADFAAGVRAYEAGDYATAYAEWLPIAERNDVAAMRNIGHLYRWGQGVEPDMQKALDWYRRAAELGFSRAQANLAAIYLQGEEGIPVNYDEAYKWFTAAAIQGHAVAQYNLGLMYELGLAVERSEPKALGWYNLAAKAGQPEALERLSQLVRRSEPPLMSGLRATAPAENRTENTAVDTLPSPALAPMGLAPPAVATVPPAETAAPPVAAATPSQPVAEPAPASVAAPMETPAMAAPTELPATDAADARPEAAPAPAPAAAPAPPVAPERPGLFGRIYNALASGGGVSIPDIFDGGESRPEPVEEAKP